MIGGCLRSPFMLSPSPLPPSSEPSSRQFRSAMGMFATGVTIVTTRTPQGDLVGLTVNSFNSVSMHPPLIVWRLAARSQSLAAFSAASHYAVNVLSADQHALALRFASSVGDRWQGVAWRPGADGAPLIAGALAQFECSNQHHQMEGDHLLFIGRVERCAHRSDAAPLIFHGGKFFAEQPL
jgi:flavin reductase (DIM6/NTAB) family NADH-FMN oxidoreductase RutF